MKENLNKHPTENVTAVILAGGRAQRMNGQDKGLLLLNGKPVIEYIINTLRPQVEHILINANRNHERYRQYGFAVIPDIVGGYFGPLAGMASGIQAAATEYIVSVPCDSPLIPDNLVSVLYRSLQLAQARLCVAHDCERMQPVYALLHRSLLPSLLDYLERGERKVETWCALQNPALADFSHSPQTFLNINSPADLEAVERYLREPGGTNS
ncbi:MAG: molybdenum cofactor guanylyltransferase MobA [Gammaproteobacteria bacterium]|nr:molybdenum cofactor guanylyltransferase MobA [Gammaproteobacteria bacterium]